MPPDRELTSADVMDAELHRLVDVETAELRALFVFRVEDTWLAVPVAQVEAVLDDTGCSRVPRTPAHILGVVTHRDRVVTVIDVGRFCALAPCTERGVFPRTLILHDGALRVGVQAEVAAGLTERVVRPLTTAATTFGVELTPFLSGECETPWGAAGVLDVGRLLEAARVRA